MVERSNRCRIAGGTEVKNREAYVIVEVYDPIERLWHPIRAAKKKEAEEIQKWIQHAIESC